MMTLQPTTPANPVDPSNAISALKGSTGDGPGTAATSMLTFATILSGLSGGFFFTYQISVIRGLAIVDDVTYLQSFQAINATVRNAPFAVVFFGTVPAIAITLALFRKASPAMRGLLALGLTLAIATVAITFAGSVPLNEELALATRADASAARAAFEAPWNQLNFARTLTSVGAAATLAMAAVGNRLFGRR